MALKFMPFGGLFAPRLYWAMKKKGPSWLFRGFAGDELRPSCVGMILSFEF